MGIGDSYNGKESRRWGGYMWAVVFCICGIFLVLIILFEYCALVISKGEIQKRRKKENKNKNLRL